jgi:hypothetical protein
MHTLPKANGHPIVAFVQTDTIDGKAAGYILVDAGDQYITAFWKWGERSWCWGHYGHTFASGLADVVIRVGGKRPKQVRRA